METGKTPIQSPCEATNTGRRRGPSPSSTFPVKLHKLLSCSEFSHIITWMPHGRSWRVLEPKLFEEIVMPKYFAQQSKYSSFTRQVNGWGFNRITQGRDNKCYCHPLFKESMPHLTRKMKRQSTPISKRAINNVTITHSNVDSVEDAKPYSSDVSDYRPQPQDIPSSEWKNNDSQYCESGHKNSYYYYPKENQQESSHSKVPNHYSHNYNNAYPQNEPHVTNYQQLYDESYQVPKQDCIGHCDNKSHTLPTPQPGQCNGDDKDTGQYGYHPHDQYYQQQQQRQQQQQQHRDYGQYKPNHRHHHQEEQHHDNYDPAQIRYTSNFEPLTW